VSALTPAIPWPFRFPRHAVDPRLHDPQGYADYHPYKIWLRDEFVFRCVYCLVRERWYWNGQSAFGVEHLRPKGATPRYATIYTNLVYACNDCNSFRNRQRLPIKVRTDPIRQHVILRTNGRYDSKTPAGEALIDMLFMNEDPYPRKRRQILEAYSRAIGRRPGASPGDFDFFTYPADLPDLFAAHPPDGNPKEAARSQCALARRSAGTLPTYY
jgi:hypothetical protein